ncbi:hypothetical protein PACTADRAFT_32355 [Pachysolen tannophilus NRRL Y-2460]|uniref:Protein BIG1 n=1 Tax=Pachysolen tannophilus NRRL Y-2460 TaxID=669874 RepID=A0A1E4TYP2_PACTA|nr:hypothetical protein PACTADRAFT_32355 [Pachysolen tannophilus NRRL Y-2460]
MKLLGLFAVAAAVLVSTTEAFKNSAPLFIKDHDVELTYFTKFKDLEFCSLFENNGGKNNFLVQVPGLKKEDLSNGDDVIPFLSKMMDNNSIGNYKHSMHCIYDSKIELFEKKCFKNEKIINISDEEDDDDSWVTQLSKEIVENNELIIIRLPELLNKLNDRSRILELNKIDSKLNKLQVLIDSFKLDSKIVIQGLPYFNSQHYKNGKNSEIISNKRKTHLKAKRDQNLDNEFDDYTESSVEDEDYAKLKEELSETFKQIEGMIGEGDTVTVYDSDSGDVTYTTNDSDSDDNDDNDDDTNSNLFTKYQFFTPGIWMGTVVSLFLIAIFSVALKWTSSLQISYKAFEKPVNGQKKVQ